MSRHESLPWIAALKVGDRVAIRTPLGNELAVVDYIHRSGRLNVRPVNGGKHDISTFLRDGTRAGCPECRGEDVLIELNGEVAQAFAAEHARNVIQEIEWYCVSDPEVLEIADRLRKMGVLHNV